MNNNPINNDRNADGLKTINAKPVKLKTNYKFFNSNWFFLTISFITVFFIKLFFQWFYAPIVLGFKQVNKKNYRSVKKQGLIILSTHIHNLDTFLIGAALMPKKVWVLMLESNLGLPFLIGKYFRIAGGVPIPTKKELFVRFMKEIPNEIKKKRAIVVLPETALIRYHIGVRGFAKGAFRIALNANATILPTVWIYKKRKGLRRLFGKKPLLHLHYLSPITLESKGSNAETIKYYEEYCYNLMKDYFNTHSDYKEQ
jgi:1-acyl-sn-glycerol-3-phosphate acyltransferase